MEQAVEMLATIHFFVMGLSHILQPQAWARFFVRLREMGDFGNFFNAFLTLGIGSLIVSFHNVWTGIPAVLTVLGWLYVAKGALYFFAPSVGLASIERVSPENARKFVVPGVFLVALSLLLAYSLLTR